MYYATLKTGAGIYMAGRVPPLTNTAITPGFSFVSLPWYPAR